MVFQKIRSHSHVVKLKCDLNPSVISTCTNVSQRDEGQQLPVLICNSNFPSNKQLLSKAILTITFYTWA